jgi:aminoglycoside phosphotransferase
VESPRAFGPGIRAVIGDDTLVELAEDAGVVRLRPARPGRSILLLYQPAADTAALLDEADRLAWLAGRGPAPAIMASGRSDGGDEALVVRIGPESTTAERGHPMGPEAMIRTFAEGLRSLHGLDVADCPFVADLDELRRVVGRRLACGDLAVAVEGPYAGREPAALVALLDRLLDDLGPPGSPVFVHGGLTPSCVWFDPADPVAFTGWRRAGVGDRHLDLAGAARLVTAVYGAPLVAPLFDAYGLDDVDLRWLDAYQLLDHLLP